MHLKALAETNCLLLHNVTRNIGNVIVYFLLMFEFKSKIRLV